MMLLWSTMVKQETGYVLQPLKKKTDIQEPAFPTLRNHNHMAGQTGRAYICFKE